jgi:hypothetical protein
MKNKQNIYLSHASSHNTAGQITFEIRELNTTAQFKSVFV